MRWAAASAKELREARKATQGVGTAAKGVGKSFEAWEGRISRATAALRKMEQVANAMRLPSMPSVSGGGGGGRSIRYGGGSGGHSPRAHRHGPGAHQAGAIVGTYPAIGAPTVSIHYLEEALKAAGGVDQVAEIQRVQGGLDHGRPMSRDQLNAEIAKNKQLAYALAFSNRATDPTENMKTITDLADLGKGDYGEARHLLPMVARMNVLTALIEQEEVKGKLQEKGQSRYLARGLDQMGVMARPAAEQEQFFKAVMQGAIGTRGIFNGKQLFGAVQHSGGTATGWSPEFVGGVLPMFSEQMNGGAAGDSIYMFAKHLLKGQMSNKTESEELVGLGLQKDSNRRGVKDFESGSIIGADVLKQNIYAWFKEFFLPALAKKGITSEEGIDKAIDNLSFAKNYAKMFHEMNANKKNIDENLKRFQTQSNPDGVLNNTMGGQLVMLLQTFKTLGSTMADPEVKGAINILRDLGETVSAFGKKLHDNPLAAQSAFGSVAALAGGVGAAGAVGLGAAAVGALPPIAIAVGAGATVTILGALIPWRELIGFSPKELAEKGADGFNKLAEGKATLDGKMPDLLKPGPSGSAIDPEKLKSGAGSIWESIKSGAGWLMNSFGEMAEKGQVEQKKVAEGAKDVAAGAREVGTAAPQAKSSLDSLGNSILEFMKKLIVSEAVVNQISFNGGGSGGSLIQRASFGGGSGPIGTAMDVPDSVAMSAPERNILGLIMATESHGRNVMNYIGDRTHTAQGYYQITNSNWRRLAPRLGITARSAMSATLEEQTRVAQTLLRESGVGNWSRYNPRLRGALQRGETAPQASRPPVPPPPRPPAGQQQAINVYLDGRKIAMNTAKHMFREGNGPATGANFADGSEAYPQIG
ncbi:transglycosylase family protein [Methylobacterium sp. J-026]|uniref:transglycosylase family protein n=1 Tax=Methylobacterium sp. J-026 TaxID=2836624 RepID=UPI001FBB601F|nr:transglycosylase family protein [Methylobacterium sp. J-026]MCJ2135610.1 transglycosylase family protein [Methylobacterium sp. J-026]